MELLKEVGKKVIWGAQKVLTTHNLYQIKELLRVMGNRILSLARKAYDDGKRLFAPLMAAPGVDMIDSTVKLVQQNSKIHYDALSAIQLAYQLDIAFPLIITAIEANALGRDTIFPKDESATVTKREVKENKGFYFDELNELANIDIRSDCLIQSVAATVKNMDYGFPKRIVRGAYVSGPFSLVGMIMHEQEACMAVLTDKDNLHRLSDIAIKKIQDYISVLIANGAQAIMILEPTSSLIGPKHLEEFSANYIKRLVQAHQYHDVDLIYHFCGKGIKREHYEKVAESGVQGISFPAREQGIDLAEVAKHLPESVVLMGNLHNTGILKDGGPENVYEETLNLLRNMEAFPNYIFSTGCDVPINVPACNLKSMMRVRAEYRSRKVIKI